MAELSMSDEWRTRCHRMLRLCDGCGDVKLLVQQAAGGCRDGIGCCGGEGCAGGGGELFVSVLAVAVALAAAVVVALVAAVSVRWWRRQTVRVGDGGGCGDV